MAQTAKKQDKRDEPELLSISEIAKRCRLHRQTVAPRLEDLGYEPDPSSTAKNQLYRFDSEMELAVKSARDTLSAMRIRDMRAAARLKEIKLAEAEGVLVPVAETIEIVQRLVGSLYQEFTVRQPKRLAARLAKAKNVTAVKKILKTDTDRVWKMLRTNFERFVKE